MRYFYFTKTSKPKKKHLSDLEDFEDEEERKIFGGLSPINKKYTSSGRKSAQAITPNSKFFSSSFRGAVNNRASQMGTTEIKRETMAELQHPVAM